LTEVGYDLYMPIAPDPNARVMQILFHENAVAEIRFADGREVVFNGTMAVELREAMQVAVMHCFSKKRRGSSGPNSSAN